MPNSSDFIQRLMAPLRDPLMLVSAHDGTIMASNRPANDMCRSLGLPEDVIGENFYELATRIGMDPTETATWKAAHSEGRFVHYVQNENVDVAIIASAEDSHVLVSGWARKDQPQAEWAHDWYALGLKNAIQMDSCQRQTAIAATMIEDAQRTLADMMRTFAARADLFQRAPFQIPLPHVAPGLHQV